MNMISRAMQRARSYWVVDGIPDILLGLSFLIAGLIFLAVGFAVSQSPTGVLLISGISIISILIGLVREPLTERLKRRITYPRTGYAAPYYVAPRQSAPLVIALIIIAVVLPVVLPCGFLAFGQLAWFTTVLPALAGLAIGLVMFCLGYTYKLMRYYILAVFCAALGIGLFIFTVNNGLIPPDDRQLLPRDLGIVFMLAGLAILISGGLTLRTYLRQAPPLQPTSYEG